MNLSVSFDWKNRSVLGKVLLDFKPYFYPTDLLILDAKGMEISSVSLKKGNSFESLEFTYNKEFLRIDLGETYTRNDQYTIQVEYEAFPEKIASAGSDAITSAQGVYFIDPDSTDVNKPSQIWTQGETEANSVWFPTIDSPNERMSQEIQITVDERYKTLSNGELVFSNYNGDGTRTDYWKQDLPHAPYLVMLAVGDYSVTTESWVNAENEEIAVDYYLEAEYAPYALDIFGNTPEMLTFYSEILGYPYPWDKYSQVVVRDFVSGAMENTSAVIHGEFLNATDRELLDGDNEAVIAHELFHHWFGDLVTCESWSNLPLNESFATYGEYLWMEYKYGRDAADLHGMNSMSGYLAESQTKQEDMIRFYYENKEDMFDGHSYNKGGRILHMLRYFLGDEAFFAGLKLYLEENKFEAVEIHQFRLAMEKVTGKDLNWFFNQWFLGSGHPDLEINYDYDAASKQLHIHVDQTQDKLFRLPLQVDIFTENGKFRERIDIRKSENTFSFPLESELLFVNVDAEKVLLGTKTDNRPDGWWSAAYENSTVFMDKFEAIQYCLKSKDSLSLITLKKAVNDPFWKIRDLALGSSNKLASTYPEFEKTLQEIALNDEKSLVRAAAVKALTKLSNDQDYLSIYENALKDRSYSVMGAGLDAITKKDPSLGLEKAKALENENSLSLKGAIAGVYAKLGEEDNHSFFTETLAKLTGFNKYGLTGTYSRYLSNQSSAFIKENIGVLEEIAANDPVSWVRLAGYSGLRNILKTAEKRAEEDAIAKELVETIPEKINALLSAETDEQIKAMMAP